MKITDIKTFVVDCFRTNWVFVKVYTDEGITGVGEGKLEYKEKALCGAEISFICEVKKASPSKGLIAPDFPYLDIALEYEAAGAAAVSCLTEPYYFMGSDEYLREIAAAVDLPVLRKDFTVNE